MWGSFETWSFRVLKILLLKAFFIMDWNNLAEIMMSVAVKVFEVKNVLLHSSDSEFWLILKFN